MDAQTTRDWLYFMAGRYSLERNAAELEAVWAMAGLHPGASVLDLACGWGRMSHLLAERGVHVHGVDLDPEMIAAADAGGTEATFEVRDMRDLDGMPTFDVVLCWWSSFGIFDDETDLRILRSVREHLTPGGRLVLETFNGAHFLGEAHTTPQGRTFLTRLDDGLLVDTRRISDDGERLVGHRVLSHAGRVSDMDYDLRVFTGSELRSWADRAGFASSAVYDRAGEPLRRDSYSVVLVATAPDGEDA